MTSAAAEIQGRVVRGPSALAGGFRRFLALSRRLAVMEFKLRFFGSALGYLWQLMRPLMLFGVLYLVFTEVVRIGSGVPHYPVVLLTGIILFTFVQEGVSVAVTSVVDRENLVRKIHFPRLAIPASVVLTALFNLGLNLVVVFIFMILQGVYPRWTWFELPLILLALIVTVSGLAMIVSALYVRFRDLRPITEVALQIAFYASPVLYPLETIDSKQLQQWMLTLNPLAVIIQWARHALIDPTAPGPAAEIGGWPRLLVPLGIVAGIFVLGFWIFNREAPHIAEDL
jgi:ABC-2 type transport system permease protein